MKINKLQRTKAHGKCTELNMKINRLICMKSTTIVKTPDAIVHPSKVWKKKLVSGLELNFWLLQNTSIPLLPNSMFEIPLPRIRI